MQVKYKFILGFLVCRILMGIGVSAGQTSSYAILTLMYPKQVNEAVAIIEGSVGIGLAVGPGFGSLLYYFYGFQGPFYGLAIIYFTMIIFIKPCVSKSVETDPRGTIHISRSNMMESNDKSHPITYRLLLSNKNIIFASMSAFTNLAQFTFIEPFFADFLNDEHGLEPAIIGFLFLALGFGYAIS